MNSFGTGILLATVIPALVLVNAKAPSDDGKGR